MKQPTCKECGIKLVPGSLAAKNRLCFDCIPGIKRVPIKEEQK